MKKNHIIHADSHIKLVKPDNIMLANDKKHIKLCDFGTAMFM